MKPQRLLVVGLLLTALVAVAVLWFVPRLSRSPLSGRPSGPASSLLAAQSLGADLGSEDAGEAAGAEGGVGCRRGGRDLG